MWSRKLCSEEGVVKDYVVSTGEKNHQSHTLWIKATQQQAISNKRIKL